MHSSTQNNKYKSCLTQVHRLLGQFGHLKLKFSFLGPLPPILLAFPFHFIKDLESFINTLYILEDHGILKLEEILDIKSVPSFYRQESSDSDTLKLIQILHLVSGKGWNKTQIFFTIQHHALSTPSGISKIAWLPKLLWALVKNTQPRSFPETLSQL